MYISEFGSYSFGKKPIYHMIPHAMRVLKMYILSKLEILKVRTTLGTLCIFRNYKKVKWNFKFSTISCWTFMSLLFNCQKEHNFQLYVLCKGWEIQIFIFIFWKIKKFWKTLKLNKTLWTRIVHCLKMFYFALIIIWLL